jgi:hypothetical protein
MDRITEDKIKQAANVVDVISDFITLRKRGVEYQGLCPFHDDKTVGNFSVNPTKGMYKCFACGAGGDAIKFLMEYSETKLSYGDALRYLAKKYSIFIDEENERDQRWANIKPAKPKPLIEVHKDMLIVPRDVVRMVMQSRQLNTFIEWFRHLPWSSYHTNNQRERVEQTLWMYCVGPWRDGRVVFWQIDEQGRPHGGKLMRYGQNGKRIRTENPSWIHTQEGYREQFDMEHHEFRPSLFGLHLLNKYPQAAVNIVESEKTALICANAYGKPEENLWMACGGMKFLKLETLQPMIDAKRTVWLWPDKDGVDDWKEKVKEILNDRVRITTKFIDENWIEDDGEKADVADIILRHMTRPETYVKREQTKTTRVSHEPLEMEPYDDPYKDEPFLDPEELADPRIREWREILRNKYNFNKRRNNDRRTNTD